MGTKELKNIQELFDYIINKNTDLSNDALARELGMSAKSFYDIKSGQTEPGAGLKRGIRGYLMRKFNMDFKELENGKVQIINKQIINGVNGTTVANNNNAQDEAISSKQLNILLDTISDLREEVKELKKKLKNYENSNRN